MKKFISIVGTSVLTMSAMLAPIAPTLMVQPAQTVMADEFLRVDHEGWYVLNNGQRFYYYYDANQHSYVLKTGWLIDGSNKYYSDSRGCVKGLRAIDGEYYYFDPDTCIMQADTIIQFGEDPFDTYSYFGSDGKMAKGTGWVKIGTDWIYTSNGSIPKGIFWVGDDLYYTDPITHLMSTGWVDTDSDGIRESYFQSNGKQAINIWVKIGVDWYYFNGRGQFVTGTQVINGKTYQFAANGKWIDDTVKKNGWVKENNNWYYYTNNVKATGWKKISDIWYYFDNSTGVMATGWKQLGNSWFYFEKSGAMVTGWKQLGNYWYYFDKTSGIMAEDWLKLGNTWYYFGSNGAMATGWVKINNIWYYFGSDGAMSTGWRKISNNWYYFTAGGAMKTGWLQLGNDWYYLNSNGIMATNMVIAGGYVGSDGIWIATPAGMVTATCPQCGDTCQVPSDCYIGDEYVYPQYHAQCSRMRIWATFDNFETGEVICTIYGWRYLDGHETWDDGVDPDTLFARLSEEGRATNYFGN